jgi:protein ImuB
MFACIYGRTVSESGLRATADQAMLVKSVSLVDLAFSFSPLVEETAVGTVVLDVEGQELLFGSPINSNEADIGWVHDMAVEIARCAAHLGLKINIGVAGNPDAAIHAARSLKGITVIPPGKELTQLGDLSLRMLDYSLARIEKDRAEEIGETLVLWGLRTFSDFARLPLAGVAQRLGQEGLRLQKLAQGRSQRHLILVQPPAGFEQSIELEHPVAELEPLSFIVARLLNQLCASLNAQALATNELRLRLKLENKTEHERAITLPVPMRNPRTFLRLLLLDIESHPPQASITAVAIAAEPAKPRVLQNGLFVPLAPEPEKLELTLARLTKLVGAKNIGSPELLDTHRPDAFRMRRFVIAGIQKKAVSNPQSAIYRGPRQGRPAGVIINPQCVMGFRMFRPPLCAEVQTTSGRPTRISAHSASLSCTVRGKIVRASGPWRASGDWWRADVWARDEWDVAVAGANGGQSEMLCRIYRDLSDGAWFVEGMYD